MKRKSTGILAKCFSIVCQMNKAKNISNFQECLDQNVGSIYFKESWAEDVFILGK